MAILRRIYVSNNIWMDNHPPTQAVDLVTKSYCDTNVVGKPPIGSILLYGAAAAPTSYFLCDGTAKNRTTYATLYNVIGTTFGVGDGSTTFNLPDLRQRFPLGKAASGTGATLGGTGGSIDHVHSTDPADTTSGAPSATTEVQSGTGATVASSAHTHNTNIVATDSDSDNPPFQVVTYIIRYA